MTEKKKENLTGQRFGRWLVIGPEAEAAPEKVEPRWLCRCDCGTERTVLERSLRYEGSRSCGCLTRQKAQEATGLKLEGQTFGELTVLAKHKVENRRGTWWLCQCSCGNQCTVQGTLLVNGRKTHCGCKSQPKKYHRADITGKKFGRLTALYLTENRNLRGQQFWHCICDCGRETDVTYNDLVHTNLQSCGCRKLEHNAELKELLTHVDGTSLEAIKSKKLPSNNTTGIKGVYYVRDKFAAKIVFQKKQYHLGFFDTLEEAAEARKSAVNTLFDGTVEHYEWWKQRAAEDQKWAEQNPFSVQVEKLRGGGLEVTFSPQRQGA